ncbi:MAG: WYL domain-containing protein [Bacillota bacterium]|nr:WYL domain-containing protein [Bacillota bacterium]
MAYSELIKNFNRVRGYMREFFVYGFKSREDYTQKSLRSYDNERRRIESWLGDYMRFHQTAEGKIVFLSIDSRRVRHNPFYRAWKSKSFTDGAVTLHFILLDILAGPEDVHSLAEICEQINEYTALFDGATAFDESTVRKKLNDYVREGILEKLRRGRSVYFRRSSSPPYYSRDVLDFFSEVAPCGVIGSFLLDKSPQRESHFSFKHHYITTALDSEVTAGILDAIKRRKNICIRILNRNKNSVSEHLVTPLRILYGVQSGRQYLMAYHLRSGYINSYRLDRLLSVKTEKAAAEFDALREKLDRMQSNIWGVSTWCRTKDSLETVTFTVCYSDSEGFIHERLEREKRCGSVERLDPNHSRFSAKLYDSSEIIPWIRSFIGRIVTIEFSNREIEERFWSDLEEMYRLYHQDEEVKG